MSKFIIPVFDSSGNKVYFETSPHAGQESVDGYESVVMWLEKNGFKFVANNVPSVATPPLNSTTQAMEKHFCANCGKEMTFKEGISAKSGKPWKGWFCTEVGHELIWAKG